MEKEIRKMKQRAGKTAKISQIGPYYCELNISANYSLYFIADVMQISYIMKSKRIILRFHKYFNNEEFNVEK